MPEGGASRRSGRQKNGASLRRPLGKFWERMPERHPPYGCGALMLQVRNRRRALPFSQPVFPRRSIYMSNRGPARAPPKGGGSAASHWATGPAPDCSCSRCTRRRSLLQERQRAAFISHLQHEGARPIWGVPFRHPLPRLSKGPAHAGPIFWPRGLKNPAARTFVLASGSCRP